LSQSAASPATHPLSLHDALPIFDAAVSLLKQQRANIGQYWSDYTKEQAAFANGDSVLGTTWQVITNLLVNDAHPTPVKAIVPSEDRKSTRLNSSHQIISYAVFCF